MPQDVLCFMFFLHKSESMCQFFKKRVTLFLSFKRVNTARNLLIDSHHYKRHKKKKNIPTAFHSLSRFTHTTNQLNPLFLKTLNYSKTIQRLVLSFSNLHSFHSNATKTLAIFWLEVHSKLMTNPALLNALAHDAKLVLSFTTPTKYPDPSDPLRSLITSRVPPPTSFIS